MKVPAASSTTIELFTAWPEVGRRGVLKCEYLAMVSVSERSRSYTVIPISAPLGRTMGAFICAQPYERRIASRAWSVHPAALATVCPKQQQPPW